MKKKLLLLTLVLAIGLNSAFSQNNLGKSDDVGRISLNPYIPRQAEKIPTIAKKMLTNKLKQIVVKSGMGGKAIDQRFVIVPSINVLSKDLTATAPPMTALNLEITLFIGDGIDGTIFSSTSQQATGVGTNATKAYIAAIKRLNPRSPDIQECIQEGKKKIIEYYNGNCDFIMKESISKAQRKQYDEAIATLLSVPRVCKECYEKCQEESIGIYMEKMENECNENIQNAKVAISNNDWDGAADYLVGILPEFSSYDEAQTLLRKIENHRCSELLGKAKGAWTSMDAKKAAYWLSQISSDSDCNAKATALQKEIRAKLKADDLLAWEQKMKEYADNKELNLLKFKHNAEMSKQKQKDEVESKNILVKAMQAVGESFGKNQAKDQLYNIGEWF